VKIAVILNGISLGKKVFYNKYLPLLKQEHTVDVYETLTMNDGIALASKAMNKRCDLIIAAGGDGTINQVLNGMLKEHEAGAHLPLLATVPLGSGNDFVKSIPSDYSPSGLAERIKASKVTEIDVGEVLYSVSPGKDGVTSIQDKRYFVNVVDVGMGPAVVRGVQNSGRPFGSAVAYYQSIVGNFFTYKAPPLKVTGDGWSWEDNVKTFALANAHYYGNGLCIAPDADLNDGELNVFACGNVSVLDFILHSIPLKQGKLIRHPKVSYFKSKSVLLTSPVAMEIEADGEIIGWLPAKVCISPFRLRILL
jgi:diacylglycerol kinase (ATP)